MRVNDVSLKEQTCFILIVKQKAQDTLYILALFCMQKTPIG